MLLKLTRAPEKATANYRGGGWGKDQKLDFLIDSFTAKYESTKVSSFMFHLQAFLATDFFLVLKAFHSILLF